jgi:hypothetical protein
VCSPGQSPLLFQRAVDDDIIEAVRAQDDARADRLLRDFTQVADITSLLELRRKLSPGCDTTHSAASSIGRPTDTGEAFISESPRATGTTRVTPRPQRRADVPVQLQTTGVQLKLLTGPLTSTTPTASAQRSSPTFAVAPGGALAHRPD